MLAALPSPENDQHFIIAGNKHLTRRMMKKKKERNAIGDDGDAHLTHVLEMLTTEKGIRFLCRDEADVHVLTAILFASGMPKARDFVDGVVRKYITFVDTQTELERTFLSSSTSKEGRTSVVFVLCSFLGKHAELWSRLKEDDIAWISYGERIDPSLLRHVLPFVFLSDFDMRYRFDLEHIGENDEDGDKTDKTDKVGHKRVHRLVTCHALVVGIQKREQRDDASLHRATARALLHDPFDEKEGEYDGGDALKTQDIMTTNNHMAIYFPYFDVSRDILHAFNAHITRTRLRSGAEFYTLDNRGLRVGRPRRAILEQFDDAEDDASPSPPPPTEEKNLLTIPLDLPDRNSVDADFFFFSSMRLGGSRITTLHVKYDDRRVPSIRHIPVREWDRVIVREQRNPSPSSRTFYVERVDAENQILHLTDALVLRRESYDVLRHEGESRDTSIDLNVSLRRRALAEHPKEKEKEKDTRTRKLLRLSHLDEDDVVFVQNVLSEGDGHFGTKIEYDEGEDEFVRILLESDVTRDAALQTRKKEDMEEWNDDMFFCLTDETVKTPTHCRALRGGTGVWDRPCRTDHECPFYQSNRRYPNYRGGCSPSGFCEMPLGVKRKGFRHVSDEHSRPLCHSCDDPMDDTCCDRQEPNPDIAFSLRP